MIFNNIYYNKLFNNMPRGVTAKYRRKNNLGPSQEQLNIAEQKRINAKQCIPVADKTQIYIDGSELFCDFISDNLINRFSDTKYSIIDRSKELEFVTVIDAVRSIRNNMIDDKSIYYIQRSCNNQEAFVWIQSFINSLAGKSTKTFIVVGWILQNGPRFFFGNSQTDIDESYELIIDFMTNSKYVIKN